MPGRPSPSNIWQEILFSRHTRVFSPYVELYIKGRPSLILRGIDCQLNNKAPQNPNDVIEVGSPCPKHYNEQKRHNLLKKNSAVGSKFPEMIKFWSAPDYYSCNLCICEACWPEAKGFQMHLHWVIAVEAQGWPLAASSCLSCSSATQQHYFIMS